MMRDPRPPMWRRVLVTLGEAVGLSLLLAVLWVLMIGLFGIDHVVP